MCAFELSGKEFLSDQINFLECSGSATLAVVGVVVSKVWFDAGFESEFFQGLFELDAVGSHDEVEHASAYPARAPATP